jgi:glycosyltransferase involved in cell wall biosynthesis
MRTPLVSAIVSTYNSERFIRGCLDDLVRQSIFEDIEVLVIDSGSQQGEAAICAAYAERHANIRFIRTERESLYAAWNRGIGMAKGEYLTNANTDDRHRSDAFEILAARLQNEREVALVYADQFVSPTENETFDACQARAARLRRWPEFTAEDLMLRCITGPQPMWRRSIHARHGLFDTHYRIAADYELWMRFAQTERFLHVPETLGVFYDSPTTLSGSGNRWQLDQESMAIRLGYLDKTPWLHSEKLRARVAQVFFSVGYRYIEHDKDPVKAKPFLRAAWKLNPLNPHLAKTYFLRGVLGNTSGLS